MRAYRFRDGELVAGTADTPHDENAALARAPGVPPPPILSPDERFYWDGGKWLPMPTRSARETSPRPAVTAVRVAWNVGGVAAAAGALAIAIGALLPWGTALGVLSVSGVQGPAGWGLLVGAVVIAVTASFSLRGMIGVGIGLTLLVVGGLLAVYLASVAGDITALVQQANASAGISFVSVGTGLYVVGAGVAATIYAGVHELIRSFAERR